MGMFSEIHAEAGARDLQKPLLAAIESNNYDIIKFCKEHIAPLYKWAVGESWSSEIMESKEHQKIKKTFY